MFPEIGAPLTTVCWAFVPNPDNSHLGTLLARRPKKHSIPKTFSIIKEPKINPNCSVSVKCALFHSWLKNGCRDCTQIFQAINLSWARTSKDIFSPREYFCQKDVTEKKNQGVMMASVFCWLQRSPLEARSLPKDQKTKTKQNKNFFDWIDSIQLNSIKIACIKNYKSAHVLWLTHPVFRHSS